MDNFRFVKLCEDLKVREGSAFNQVLVHVVASNLPDSPKWKIVSLDNLRLLSCLVWQNIVVRGLDMS
jgi:hypothetical protein